MLLFLFCFALNLAYSRFGAIFFFRRLTNETKIISTTSQSRTRCETKNLKHKVRIQIQWTIRIDWSKPIRYWANIEAKKNLLRKYNTRMLRYLALDRIWHNFRKTNCLLLFYRFDCCCSMKNGSQSILWIFLAKLMILKRLG